MAKTPVQLANSISTPTSTREQLIERLKKIPEDKLGDFQYGYGDFIDPFDFERENFQPLSFEDMIKHFDDRNDWSGYLEEFLTERGY